MSCENINNNADIKQASYDALNSFYENIYNVYKTQSDSIISTQIKNEASNIYRPKNKTEIFSDEFKNVYSDKINTNLNNIDYGLYNLYLSDPNSNIYANCVLQTGNKWFTTSYDYNKCTIVDNIDLPRTIVQKNDAFFTNFTSKDKSKPAKSLYASNINKAYCENRWYDWIITPNYYLGNTYFKDIGKYTDLDVNKCYKPCEGDYMPFMTEKNEFMCIPKKYYGSGIFNNKYMFCPLGLINLIGNFAATLKPENNAHDKNGINANNDYNFILYKLILEYNLKTNVDSNIYSVQENISNIAINYNNVKDDFKDIFYEFNNSINDNILKNFINSQNQDYYYSPNFTYKSPLFNEKDPEMYTLKGLQANNLLTDPILIHTWVLANIFKPYPVDSNIDKRGLSSQTKITYNNNSTSRLLYDALYEKMTDNDDSLRHYKASRLKNIFFKAVNICYDNMTDFSKNIILNTINALNNNKLISYIYSEKLYLTTGHMLTGVLTNFQNFNIGINDIQTLKQVLTQTELEKYVPYKYYDDKNIADIKKNYTFVDITKGDNINSPTLEFNNYLFAYEDLEKQSCLPGNMFDNKTNTCKPIPPKPDAGTIDNTDNFDDGLQIPRLKTIFYQFLKIIIAIIIIYVIYFLYNIWYESIVEFFNYAYLKTVSAGYGVSSFLNEDKKSDNEYYKQKLLLENLKINKEKLDDYIERLPKKSK